MYWTPHKYSVDTYFMHFCYGGRCVSSKKVFVLYTLLSRVGGIEKKVSSSFSNDIYNFNGGHVVCCRLLNLFWFYYNRPLYCKSLNNFYRCDCYQPFYLNIWRAIFIDKFNYKMVKWNNLNFWKKSRMKIKIVEWHWYFPRSPLFDNMDSFLAMIIKISFTNKAIFCSFLWVTILFIIVY